MYNNKELSASFVSRDELARYVQRSDLDAVSRRIPNVPTGFNFANVAQRADLDALSRRIPNIPAGFDFTKVAQQTQLQPLQSDINQLKARANPDLSIYALKRALATPRCSQQTTPASAWGAIETHNIDCPTGQVLKRIKANKLANGQLQYSYDCCSYSQ
jgi:hypothetical protein